MNIEQDPNSKRPSEQRIMCINIKFPIQIVLTQP